jgi:hypothetical protein
MASTLGMMERKVLIESGWEGSRSVPAGTAIVVGRWAMAAEREPVHRLNSWGR